MMVTMETRRLNPSGGRYPESYKDVSSRPGRLRGDAVRSHFVLLIRPTGAGSHKTCHILPLPKVGRYPHCDVVIHRRSGVLLRALIQMMGSGRGSG
jgi:hypothetical protein